VLDEELVGGPQEVRELEVLVPEPPPVEVLDELPPLGLGDLLLADLLREVDRLEHVLERVRVLVLELAEGVVQPLGHVLLQFVVDEPPARRLRDVERPRLAVIGFGVRPLPRLLGASSARELFPDDLVVTLLEDVRAPLEEEHAEDELLVVGGVHLPAEDVRGLVEVPLELGQGQSAHLCDSIHPLQRRRPGTGRGTPPRRWPKSAGRL
jgi:hypothetical protein